LPRVGTNVSAHAEALVVVLVLHPRSCQFDTFMTLCPLFVFHGHLLPSTGNELINIALVKAYTPPNVNCW